MTRAPIMPLLLLVLAACAQTEPPQPPSPYTMAEPKAVPLDSHDPYTDPPLWLTILLVVL